MDDSVPGSPVSKKVVRSTPPTDDQPATLPLSDQPQPVTTQKPGETQPLTPASQRFTTQPTQLVDDPRAVVQVAASSPPGPTSTTTAILSSSPFRPTPQQGGPLSNSLAPAGTQFRPPTSAGPARRAPVVDLDDDGPTYRGGSSDEEEDEENTDIKPAQFTKNSRSPEQIMESPVNNGAGAAPNDRFKQITSSSVYDPNSSHGAKRPASEMGGSMKGMAVKKQRQDGPSRAQPVVAQISSLDEIADYPTRSKVERMMKIMTNKSIQQCFEAMVVRRGIFNDALEYLVAAEEQGGKESDDELSVKASGAAPAKQQIKARGTIQDKWSSMRMPNAIPRPSSPQDDKPRRRLVRGPKNREPSPASPIRSEAIPPKKTGRLVKGRRQPSPARSESPEEPVAMTEDDSDSGVEETQGDSELELKVLRFFNTCQTLELADIAATTEELANAVIAKRPFGSLDEVRIVPAPTAEQTAKPKGSRGRKTPKPIGDKIVDKCLDMWVGYEAVDSLCAKCEELGKPLATEMKKWGVDIYGKKDGDFELTSIDPAASHDSGIGTPASQRSEDDEDGPKSRKGRFIGQPGIMVENLKMKDYQVVGINWLSLLFEKELSCILADDMGLGKTCQVIAFLAHLYEKGIKGPHLVVVPSSTIENWLREFQKFCPTLSVMPYYAGQAERAVIRETIEDNRDSINVIITTYTIAKAKVDASFLRSMDFCACIYDEGHMLKSSTSVLYEKLIRIPAQFKLLLTGTPLQNNLQELASLLGFILPKVFQERKDQLQYIFSNKAKTNESHTTLLSAQRIERAKSMLKPFVLRRKKHQVIDLPAKISRVEWCELNASQKEIYEHEKEEVRKLVADRAAGKKTGSKSANILMKLRQAAIHSLLYRRHYNDSVLKQMSKACLKEPQWSLSDPNVIFEELQPYNDFECHTMCTTYPKSLGKFALKNGEWMDSGKVNKLCELLERFKDDRILVFSQFTMVMDILEHVLENQHVGFVRLDGRTNVEDRQSILDAFHERTDIPVFLLSTKAGGAGINLACANKVIIFDSSFNPQEDVQAENRAHRVGQTREVEVIRLVTKDTIEEQIYALGQTKLALDQAVAGDEADSKKGEEAGMKVVEDMVFADMETKDKGEKST
ncbi:uncharacterized protein ACHE_70084S [Aspergillus chevalieri]|uniref:DNA helicase n=1 Tax=Aspergillus chevalieri TaxID=182096 RepID=A0A7R7VUX1_ASPCH|nr:uncharacterized protein ACHE_70084S [Aspergillus chevalieri]BCR91241.1 hypothetical protein ACHE_70084S [Aspergillus chevalieri]